MNDDLETKKRVANAFWNGVAVGFVLAVAVAMFTQCH